MWDPARNHCGDHPLLAGRRRRGAGLLGVIPSDIAAFRYGSDSEKDSKGCMKFKKVHNLPQGYTKMG